MAWELLWIYWPTKKWLVKEKGIKRIILVQVFFCEGNIDILINLSVIYPFRWKCWYSVEMPYRHPTLLGWTLFSVTGNITHNLDLPTVNTGQFCLEFRQIPLTLLLVAQPATVQAFSWYEYSIKGWIPSVSEKLSDVPRKHSIPFRRRM